MLIHKLRLAAMTVLGLAAIATGAGLVTRSLAMKDDGMKNPTRHRLVGTALLMDAGLTTPPLGAGLPTPPRRPAEGLPSGQQLGRSLAVPTWHPLPRA